MLPGVLGDVRGISCAVSPTTVSSSRDSAQKIVVASVVAWSTLPWLIQQMHGLLGAPVQDFWSEISPICVRQEGILESENLQTG